MRKATLACLAVAVCASLALPSIAAAQEFPPASRFQKVTLNDRPGEPMASPCCPTVASCTAPAPARSGSTTRRPGSTRWRPTCGRARRASTSTTRRASRASRSTRTSAQPLGLRLLLAEAQHPGRRARHGHQRGRRAVQPRDARGPRAARAVQGRHPALALQVDGSELDFDSEQQILDVPVDRGICCHVGGKIDFDGEGNLYLSTGDDTNPFESDGYSPIDERATRNPAFDAQRTSANTNDLRGKILRIRVKTAATTRPGAATCSGRAPRETKPEIYAMGFRNPFRMAVDKKSNNVYVGDYSPDANAGRSRARPAGHRPLDARDRPGNYGWPYCMTPQLGYVDYDFATGSPARSSRARTRSTSRRTTRAGACCPRSSSRTSTTAIRTTTSACSRSCSRIAAVTASARWAARRTTSTPSSRSETKWPSVFDGHPLFYEWTRDYFKVFELNRQNGNRLDDIHNLFPGGPSGIIQDNPMDMEFGPDGALYTLEYGDGFFLETPEAQLGRIDFVRGNEYTPIPQVRRPRRSARPAADGAVLERRDARPRRRHARVRVGLRRRRHGRLAPAERVVHLHRARHLRRHADGDRQHGPLGVRLRADHRGQPGAGGQPDLESTTPPFNFGDTVHFTVR